ncbi:MAG: hypothetical protein RLZZ519_3451, partial [Bacteroidota bacterium]
EELKAIFETLTLGKKRNVIHSINKIKDLDKQIMKTMQIIRESTQPRRRKPL